MRKSLLAPVMLVVVLLLSACYATLPSLTPASMSPAKKAYLERYQRFYSQKSPSFTYQYEVEVKRLTGPNGDVTPLLIGLKDKKITAQYTVNADQEIASLITTMPMETRMPYVVWQLQDDQLLVSVDVLTQQIPQTEEFLQWLAEHQKDFVMTDKMYNPLVTNLSRIIAAQMSGELSSQNQQTYEATVAFLKALPDDRFSTNRGFSSVEIVKGDLQLLQGLDKSSPLLQYIQKVAEHVTELYFMHQVNDTNNNQTFTLILSAAEHSLELNARGEELAPRQLARIPDEQILDMPYFKVAEGQLPGTEHPHYTDTQFAGILEGIKSYVGEVNQLTVEKRQAIYDELIATHQQKFSQQQIQALKLFLRID